MTGRYRTASVWSFYGVGDETTAADVEGVVMWSTIDRRSVGVPEATAVEDGGGGSHRLDGVLLIQIFRGEAVDNNRVFGSDKWTPGKIDRGCDALSLRSARGIGQAQL
jgi:hypothetical protein